MNKKYSLALGGGSALGLSHIGVIKYIEEKNIQIDEIAGTSMGSVVASFYAIGINSNDMTTFAKNVNYLKLIDIDLKEGLLKGNKIYKKLYEVFGDKKIEETKIKLKIIATNIDNGEKIIFTKGKIIDAIRASISLPGIFKPYKIDGNHFIDGGIVNNLPIEVLSGKYIIASSALKSNIGKLEKNKNILGFSFKIGILSLTFQVLERSIIIMMKNNEEKSLSTPNKKILYINPNFEGYEIYNFDKIDELISLGYNESKNIIN